MTEIRELFTAEELRAVESLQRKVWGWNFDLISIVALRAALETGGVVLGAFDEDELIGFVVGYLGMDKNGELFHYSTAAGVLKERRNQGIGYELKRRQRDFALTQGLDVMRWCYDPLESLNGHFNFSKLGVICRRFEHEYYGNMVDDLNRGLPTDRFMVEWALRSPRVVARLKHEEQKFVTSSITPVNRTIFENGLPVIVDYSFALTEPSLLVEIPYNFQKLKAIDRNLALRWKLAVREIFEHYFARGYIATDFLSQDTENSRRSFYLLERNPLEEILARKLKITPIETQTAVMAA